MPSKTSHKTWYDTSSCKISSISPFSTKKQLSENSHTKITIQHHVGYPKKIFNINDSGQTCARGATWSRSAGERSSPGIPLEWRSQQRPHRVHRGPCRTSAYRLGEQGETRCVALIPALAPLPRRYPCCRRKVSRRSRNTVTFASSYCYPFCSLRARLVSKHTCYIRT